MICVATLRAVTFAFGTTAPDESVTVPDREEASDWARTELAVIRERTMTAHAAQVQSHLFLTRDLHKITKKGMVCFMIALPQRFTCLPPLVAIVNERNGEF